MFKYPCGPKGFASEGVFLYQEHDRPGGEAGAETEMQPARKPWAPPVVIVAKAEATDMNLKGGRAGDYLLSGNTYGS